MSNHFVMVGPSRFHHRKKLTNECVAHDHRKYETLSQTQGKMWTVAPDTWWTQSKAIHVSSIDEQKQWTNISVTLALKAQWRGQHNELQIGRMSKDWTATESSGSTKLELPMIDITWKRQQQTDSNCKNRKPSSRRKQITEKTCKCKPSHVVRTSSSETVLAQHKRRDNSEHVEDVWNTYAWTLQNTYAWTLQNTYAWSCKQAGKQSFLYHGPA